MNMPYPARKGFICITLPLSLAAKGRLLLAALLLLLPFQAALAQELRIGVLALRGSEKALENWSATASYLQQRLPGYHVSIVPLGFDEIKLAASQRRVEFILANPSYYVELETRYGASPVVTRKSCHNGMAGHSQFGGVIFTRADRQDLRDIRELHHQRFGAVDPNSFGGWHAGWRELLHHDITPEKDFKSLRFFGTHDNVVRAVLDGEIDAGTVRTETLELMAAEGQIRLGDVHILNPRVVEGFPFLLSTELYPEWPLARLPGVPDKLAIDVAVALMQIPPGHPALTQSQTAGWTLPLNYQPVLEALRELRIGPYEYLREYNLREVLREYGHWLVILTLALLLALFAAAYVARINRRLKDHQIELQQLNDSLGERVQERTEQIAQLLRREHYLRGIVETVADVNQIIITADSPENMLKACCDRLIAHRDYRFAWIGQLSNEDTLDVTSRSWGPADAIRQLTRTDEATPAYRSFTSNQTLTEPCVSDISFGGSRIFSVTALPLRKDAFAQPEGVLCVYSSRTEGFEEEEIAMLEQLAGDIGFAINAFGQEVEAERLQRERIHHYEETILSLVDMIEKRDTYTAGHTRRVADYSSRIAAEMGLPALEIEKLHRAAILHDIGKIAIPDAVLLKPGRLSDLEFDLIKQHVEVGYQTLAHIEMYKELAEIMRHHHEWIDGSGYPQGLKGDQIPRLSQIMAVADAFDAMTTNRIYKPRKEVSEALAELRSLAGIRYAPEIVQAAEHALRNVTIPPAGDQLPKTPLEKQRFAYFFNDALTGLHNGDYLRFLLANNQYHDTPHAALILLRGFSAFSAQNGWTEGEKALRAVAQWLTAHYPQATAFRIMGDDFLLLSDAAQDISPASLETGPLADSGLHVEIRPFDLEHGGLAALDAILK